MKIVHLLAGKEKGGITTATATLARHMIQAGHQISFLVVGKSALADDPRLAPFQVQRIPKEFSLDPRTVSAIAKFCRQQQVDVLCTHSIPAHVYGRIACFRQQRTAQVSTIHGWAKDLLNLRFHGGLRSHLTFRQDLWMSRLSDRVICVSGWLAQQYLEAGISAQILRTIPHGVDTQRLGQIKTDPQSIRRQLSIPDDAVVVGIVGRLTAIKRHDLYLQAIRMLREKHRHVWGLIVGDGELRTSLEDTAVALGVRDNIVFTGWVDHPGDYMRAMNILTQCSDSEGFSYTVVEGLVIGLPVVATAVCDIPNLLSDGNVGLLVPPGDAGALSNSLSRIVDNPDIAQQLTEAAQAVNHRWSIEREVDSTLAVYEEALTARRAITISHTSGHSE